VIRSQRHSLKGPSLIIAGMLCFATMDSLTVFLIKEISVIQLLTVRYWIFAIFALIFAYRQIGFKQAFQTPILSLQVTRSLFALAEVGIFVFGLKFLSLSEAHALLATFPLLTIVMAALFLKEKLRLIEITGVFAGLIGTLIILKPGSNVFTPEALIPLLAAILFASYQIMTRFVTDIDPYPTTLLYTAITGTVVSTLIVIPYWSGADVAIWGLIILMGSLGAAAQWLVISALHTSTASKLQPFNYSLLVFATVLGYVIFDQVPDIHTIVGATIIISAGLFVVLNRDQNQNQ